MNKIKDSLVADFLEFAVEANSRSTVDIRDGLKPVHRRILYTMDGMKQGYNASIRVVGNVLGNYHPHGDASVYNAAVRLSQDFKTRYPLVDIFGNNGSLSEPMGFAAARYTQMKLTPLGMETLHDIKKETVNMEENFDGTMMEPEYLPGLVPITLMNGTLGIGVGMATSIPPHNLREISNAITYLIDNPAAEVKDLMRYIKGPDFPTGGTVINPEALLDAYETGSGSAKIKADYEVKTISGRTHIIIKEVPYLVDPEKRIIAPLKEMYAEGYEYIEDIQVQTGKGKDFQLDITLSKGAPIYNVLETLVRETAIESSFTINLTTRIGDNKFQKQNLKSLLQSYIDQNASRNIKATEFDVRKAEARKLIVEGLIKATENIDEVVKIIRGSSNTAEADTKIQKFLDILPIQSKAILDMRLARLTKLDATKLADELGELVKTLKVLNGFLKDKSAQLTKIKTDIQELSKKYGDARKTAIKSETEIHEVQDVTVFLTSDNEIYIQPTDKLATNNRNTKGKKEEDLISVVETKSNGLIWIAAETGMVYPVEVASLTISDDVIKNTVNNFGVRDKAVQVLKPLNKDNMITITQDNTVKRSSLLEYSTDNSFRACKVREDDALKHIYLVDDNERLVMLLKNKRYVAFDIEEIRSTGTNTIGTILGGKDVLEVVPENDYIIFVDANGNGKKILKSNIKTSGRKTNGLECNDAVHILSASEDDHLYIFGDDGRMIRIPLRSINKTVSPTAKGVILYNGNIGKILTN